MENNLTFYALVVLLVLIIFAFIFLSEKIDKSPKCYNNYGHPISCSEWYNIQNPPPVTTTIDEPYSLLLFLNESDEVVKSGTYNATIIE